LAVGAYFIVIASAVDCL